MQPVYISYPEDEYDFAHQLIADLQDANYVVFVDAVSAPGSPAWASETRRAIRSSGALIMILSPQDGRRTGTRHEGVLALRGNKPFVVIRRTPGDLPRFAQQPGVVELDGTGDYHRLLDALKSALPAPETLLLADTPVRRLPARPPRPPQLARRRRRIFVTALLALMLLCLAAGVVLGQIPL